MGAGEGRSLRKLEGGWLGALHIEERPGGTPVVVRTIPSEALRDPQARARLAALAVTQAKPADPGLAAVLACTPRGDRTLTWVTPFVDGEDLAAYVRRQPARAAEQSLGLGHEIARLLCVGQGTGYHHLALRPSQVLLTLNPASPSGLAVSLLGLGLMQALGWERPPSVPTAQRIFLAPEQATGAASAIDERSDVYALGVLLLYLWRGRMPTADDVARASGGAGQLLSDRALRDETTRLVQRMLMADPSQRPMLREVVQALSLESQAAQLNATLAPDTAEAGPATAKITTPSANGSAPQDLATLPPPPDGLLSQVPSRSTQRDADRFVGTLPPDEVNAHGATDPQGPAEFVRSQAKSPPAAAPTPSAFQHAGLVYGNFRIVRRIGRGGMGVIYEAEHQQIGRRAAVKILHPKFAARPDFATRFLNEARAVNIVRHPGLVEIFEFGQQPDGTLYIVMEFLQGESLRTLLQKQAQPYAIRQILGWSLQIARALCATHEKGIIHRDLKPENIMVIPDPLRAGQDWVKLLDFGIAKVGASSGDSEGTDDAGEGASDKSSETAAGATMGTPVYMAPEQDSSAATVDGQADVFSFGVLLYEMLAGKRPYSETWIGLRTTSPQPLGALRAETSVALSELVLQMLALSPTERPKMAEVQARLSAVLDELERVEQPAQPVARERQEEREEGARRRTRVLLPIGGFLVLLVALTGYLGYRALRTLTLAESRDRALQIVKGSLQAREGNEGLQAVRALGRSRDSEYRPLLEPLLRHTQPATVAAVARGLGELSAVESQGALLAALEGAQEPAVRVEVAAALAQLSHPKGIEVLRALVQSGEDAAKLEASLRLLEFGDPAGAALLHKLLDPPGAVPGPSADEGRKLAVLVALARAGDPQARQRLAQQFQAMLNRGTLDPTLAFSVARLGEAAARRELVRAASQTGPDQIIAARFLAALGQPEGYAVLLAAGQDGQVPERQREVAFEGLGDSGQTPAASMMARALDEAAVTSRFRLSAAGSILQLAGGAVGSYASRSLSWARAALGSDSSATRELAVMLLGDLPSDETIAPLRIALKDASRDVRAGAARALGRKTVRTALDALADALDDADEDVRASAIRSIGQVARALQGKGEASSASDILARLRQLLGSGTAVDRIVIAGTLLLLGDKSHLDILREGLRAASALVRRLAAELLDADATLLRAALNDPERQVRLVAARRLAGLGLRDGLEVLRAALGAGGADGLLAYGLLAKLGERVEPPADLLGLFAGRGLREKEILLDLLSELPADIALDLLLRAAADASSMIRRRAAEFAFDLWQRTLQNAFVHVLLDLHNDRDVVVRARVAELVAKLPATTGTRSGADADRLAPRWALSRSTGEPSGTPSGSAAVPPSAAASDRARPASATQSKPSKSAGKTAAGGESKTISKNDPRAKTMGLIQVFVMKKGRCQMTQQYFLPPGDHIVNVAGGASQTVSVYAGSVIPVRQCP